MPLRRSLQSAHFSACPHRAHGLAAALVALCLVAVLAPAAAAREDAPPQGWLGVSLGSYEPPPRGEESPLGLEGLGGPAPLEGALVVGVVRDSPADLADLRAGDLVVRVDGQPVRGPGELVRAVAGREPGASVTFDLVRQGRQRQVTLRLDEKPERAARMELKEGWVGVTPVDVPVALREAWGGDEERGVLIGAVDAGGPAARAGLRPGDLVLTWGEEPIAGARQLILRARRGGIGNVYVLEVSRQGAFFTAELEIDERPPEDELAEREERQRERRQRVRSLDED